jgi:hypothetical protein
MDPGKEARYFKTKQKQRKGNKKMGENGTKQQ